jgi:phosphate transport system permease protein
VDAARPMVYTTALLLLVVVLVLNLAAILIRNRLRKRYAGSAF